MNTITKKDVEIVKKRLKLTRDSKILNISHFGCIDGSTSSIPIYNIFKNVHYIRAKFNEINDISKYILYKNYDAVIFTDISPKDSSLIKDKENVLVIDHHETEEKNHEPDNMRFVYIGECASVQSQKFFSMYFNEDLSYLDGLIKYVNDYDMWIDPHGKSWEYNVIHYYYLKQDKFKHTDFIQRFKNGDIKLNEEEKEHVKLRKKELEEKWNDIRNRFHDLPYNINGCIIFESDFVNELLHRLMDTYGFDVAINKNPNTFQCSVRSNGKIVKVGETLDEIGIGGGHDCAAGFNDNRVEDFKNNLDKVCKYMHDKYEGIRL